MIDLERVADLSKWVMIELMLAIHEIDSTMLLSSDSSELGSLIWGSLRPCGRRMKSGGFLLGRMRLLGECLGESVMSS